MSVYSLHVITSRVPLQGVATETSSKSGYYDITASIVLLDEDLDIPTIFYCELRIPGTSYTQRKKFVYYPGMLYVDRQTNTSVKLTS